MDMQSCLVNSVHDSVVIDVHPDEIEAVIQTITDMNEDLNYLVEKAYGVTMNVPLLLEAKLGDNWLDMTDVQSITKHLLTLQKGSKYEYRISN